MKKIMALLSAVLMAFSLCACSGSSDTNTEPASPQNEVQQETEQETSAENAETTAEDSAENTDGTENTAE